MDINYQEEVAQGAWVHTLLKANKGIKYTAPKLQKSESD